jgi:hypothetical protein
MLSMTFELVSFKPLAVQGKCFSRYMKNLGARNPKREVRVMIERFWLMSIFRKHPVPSQIMNANEPDAPSAKMTPSPRSPPNRNMTARSTAKLPAPLSESSHASFECHESSSVTSVLSDLLFLGMGTL